MFGINAVGGFPPAAAEEFPLFIQFQNQGTDLGGPDADTVNFSTGLTATRGTGENANVVTVTADGGGGGGGFNAYTSQVQNGTGLANDGEFYPVESCDFTIYSEGTGISCNGSTFTLDGGYVYEFVCTFRFDGATGANFDEYMEYGVRVGGTGESVHSRYLPVAGGSAAPRVTDTFIIPTLNGGDFDVEVYMTGSGAGGFGVSGDILVRQVGNYNPS